MKLTPLGDRVVLKQLEAETTTKSGIVLTTATQEKPQEAEVVAVGPGGMVDGKEVTMQVICRNRSKIRRWRIYHRKTEWYFSSCRIVLSHHTIIWFNQGISRR